MTPLEVHDDGVRARVELAGDGAWPAVDPTPVLPDVSRLPGARFVGVATAERDGVRVVLGCLRAPSSKWVPGLQSVVFERATPMMLGVASMRPALERGPTLEVGGASFVEHLVGAEGERSAVVAHALAFAGPDADAVVCSLACAAPTPTRACDAIAASMGLSGDLRSEPPPGLVASSILAAANHPVVALALAAAVGSAVVVTLLLTRPKLRPTARRRRLTRAADA